MKKGIILAGGRATRLWPITKGCCKQLLPVYDKPMIYYPLATLIKAGCTDILIITTEHDKADFSRLLWNGREFGINIKYAVQKAPQGIAQAFLIAHSHDFLTDNDEVCLALGDNIYFGEFHGFLPAFSYSSMAANGFAGLGIRVSNPSQYGVVELDTNTNKIVSIEEKPTNPKSDIALAGLYYFTGNTVKFMSNVRPSARGELEIVDLIRQYKDSYVHTPDNAVWLDAGTMPDLCAATDYVRAVQERSGKLIGSPHYEAWKQNRITTDFIIDKLSNTETPYYQLLKQNVRYHK